MTPRNGLPGATVSATSHPERLPSNTIGRRQLVSNFISASAMWQMPFAVSRSRTMTANGFRSRCWPPQFQHGGRIACIAREMEPADTFDRHDFSGTQCVGGISDRIVRLDGRTAGPAVAIAGRSAGRQLAGRENAGRARVLVLTLARVTHGKSGHGGALAVVGCSRHNRQPRAAIGAIEERIAAAAIVRIE